jgi:myo-inositol-1(or 4)-monophosphatase
MADLEIRTRLDFAKKLTKKAGEKAIVFFESIGDLIVQQKGAQDLVSNADLEVEVFIRKRIAESYPNDGIVGEEHANVEGTSGYTWVIDPVDGTANFLTAIPSWCVVLACVHDDQTKLGVVYEPSHNEMFWGAMGAGAFLNDKPMQVSPSTTLSVGSTGIGMNGRTAADLTVSYIKKLVDRGGIFYRNASGALMLSYVAAGRLIGYAEPHMNAWDCLAGQLLIAEAGGCVENQSANDMLLNGGRVVASGPGVFEEMVKIANEAYLS